MWLFSAAATQAAAPQGGHADAGFPAPIESYVTEEAGMGLGQVLRHRIAEQPFNLVATVLFLCAIIHTFCAGPIRSMAHKAHHAHEERQAAERERAKREGRPIKENVVCFRAEVLHFLGEVEAIFGLWVIPLIVAITITHDFHTAEEYVGFGVNFTEPLFVVVIMTIAATRPVVRLAEQVMARVAGLWGGTPAAWWFSILTLGPVLGSFITEPAAMTISALLLARRFFEYNPGRRLKYATLGLLFVNVSVGGTLTHFAAPPVLMVAAKWEWGLGFMFMNLGWKAVVGILVCNGLYFAWFRRELRALAAHRPVPVRREADGDVTPWEEHDWPVPAWITAVHLGFMAWTVLTAHYPSLFIGGFLFFLAFVTTTFHHQEDVKLKPALLVGFFLAGLVIHGGLQQWWIEPVLGSLSTLPLMLGATVLTAFNDNAAITYLASLVPGFTPEMKYAVVAGAVTGGGLTVIANAPNPAGQSILQRFFEGGVSPLGLFLGALVPTVILGFAFMLLP
jgi:hypothetical protein